MSDWRDDSLGLEQPRGTEYAQSFLYRTDDPIDRDRALSAMHDSFNLTAAHYGFPDAVFSVYESPLKDGWAYVSWSYVHTVTPDA